MVFIKAKRQASQSIKFEFYGEKRHILTARSALEVAGESAWIDIPVPSLIINVTDALLAAIAGLASIESVNGEAFAALFVPEFGQK